MSRGRLICRTQFTGISQGSIVSQALPRFLSPHRFADWRLLAARASFPVNNPSVTVPVADFRVSGLVQPSIPHE